MNVKEISITSTAEFVGSTRTQFLNDLEDQPLPFEWRCVSTRTLGLWLDGEETPIYIMLNDDGTWTLNTAVQV